jgi:hypothetical protein
MKESNLVAGLLVFMLLIGLPLYIYNQFQTSYGFTPTSTSTMEELQNIMALDGIYQIRDTIISIGSFKTPTEALLSSFEVLSGASIGILKVIIGLSIIPFQITTIVCKTFGIPPQFSNLIGLIMQMYVIFMIYDLLRRRQ